jgi:large subunit ribosomal protein L4e
MVLADDPSPISLPTAKITNPDVTRLINSDEIQSIVRPANQKHKKRPWTQKKNPLVNKAVLFRLNPYAKTLRRQELRKCYLRLWARSYCGFV